MNILKNSRRRCYFVERYSYNSRRAKHYVACFHCSRSKLLCSIVYHWFLNLFTDNKTYCRIVGSYVR